MSCESGMHEPGKVSEVLAGTCLVGRPASALVALLGFNTHLGGPKGRGPVRFLVAAVYDRRLSKLLNALSGQRGCAAFYHEEHQNEELFSRTPPGGRGW